MLDVRLDRVDREGVQQHQGTVQGAARGETHAQSIQALFLGSRQILRARGSHQFNDPTHV